MSSQKDLTPEEMNLVLEANKLTYRKALNSSLVNTRQKREYNFTPTNYLTKQTAQAEIVLGSGSDFIYGPGSFLKLTLQAVDDEGKAGAESVHLGQPTSQGNSVMNIFKTSDITHRSGDQLDRVANLNALSSALVAWSNDDAYSGRYAGSFGGRKEGIGGGANYDDLKVEKTYCVPLWLVSGLFAQEELLPGHLCGGMRIRLEFEDFKKSIANSTGASQTQWKISGMSVVLDSFQLYDSVISALSEAQANISSQGLQYNYYAYHNVGQTANTDFNIDVNFSAGVVNQVILKQRTIANFVDDVKDSVGADAWDYSQVQSRLGSLVFPRHPIKSEAEAYNQTSASFDADPMLDLIQPVKASVGVAYGDYVAGGTGEVAFSGQGVAIVAWDMEKNQTLKGTSGVLTNNSRLISVNGSVETDAPHRFDIWVKHMRVVNIMLDNVVVDR